MKTSDITSLAKFAADKLEHGVALDSIAKNLSAYLVVTHESRELPKIMRAIEKELVARGTQQVEITSAHSVSEEIKQQLATLLGTPSPVFHETIDSSVIGGVKARSGESEIDLTVRGKLQTFRSRLTGIQ